MGVTARHLIGFNNGVFDTRAGKFRPHRQEDWLLIASDVEFIHAADGETLKTHAPAFWKWLTWSTAGNARKADCVLAALYMVMANRYGAMSEYGKSYDKKRTKQGMRTNIKLTEESGEWLSGPVPRQT